MHDTDTFDPVLVLSRLIRKYAFNLATSNACVLLMNSGHHSLTIEYGMGVMEPYVGRIIQSDDGVAGHVLSTNQPQFIPDYLQWAQKYKRLIADTSNRFKGVAGTPVYRDGEIWAILSFIWENVDSAKAAQVMATLVEISETATQLIARLEENQNPTPYLPPLPATGFAAML